MNHQLQPDEFECAVQVRAAHDRIIGEAYVITEILDLDPACVEGMQVACRRDDATTAMREAACQLVEAVNEEHAIRPS
jgi:hypothetical protein